MNCFFNKKTKNTKKKKMSQFNLSCGCYESILIGLDFDVKKIDKAVRANDAKTAEQLMKMAFALPSHLGSIRVVASNSKYLVTGATDEQLKYVLN